MSNHPIKTQMAALFGDVVHGLQTHPVTERYPFVRRDAPLHLRGRLHYTPKGCTGCALCIKDCPSEAIQLITLDKAAKRFVIEYHVDRCTFCGQCVTNCRFDCLELAHDEWELASTTKEPFTSYYGDEADVNAYLSSLGAIPETALDGCPEDKPEQPKGSAQPD